MSFSPGAQAERESPALPLLGMDLVFVPRLAKTHARFGSAFFQKLLTEAEWLYSWDDRRPDVSFRRLAARLAAKEAVAKALGTGLSGLGWSRGIGWKEIEVVSLQQAPPGLRLTGRAEQAAENSGVTAWRLSLSHDGDYAAAVALGS